MKILICKEEKCYGFMIKNKAYTIARHGRPFGDLWEKGWRVSAVKLFWPYFGILRYEKS